MLDINFIKDNKVWVSEAIKNKRLQQEVDVEELLNVYESYQNVLRLVETKRALRNKITQDITKFLDPEHAYERQKLMQEAVDVIQKNGINRSAAKSALEKLYVSTPFLTDCDILDSSGIMITVEPPSAKSLEGADVSGQKQVKKLH